MADMGEDRIVISVATSPGTGTFDGNTDGELLDRFARHHNDEADAAFAALVRLHGAMVWNVCHGVLSDAHLAEDAFQATFLFLARRSRSIRRRDTVGPWLYSVARRISMRAKVAAIRRQQREAKLTGNKPLPAPDPIQREQIEALHDEVGGLAEKYRAPLVLCYFEGRTHAEAARLLGCPVGTVSFRLTRARELLRGRLTRRGLALSATWLATTLGSETTAAEVPSRLIELTIKGATNLAAGKAATAGLVSASAAHLIQGKVFIMTSTKLVMIVACVAAAGVTMAGVAMLATGGGPTGSATTAAASGNPPSPAPAVPATAPPANADDEETASRGKIRGQLLNLGLALSNYANDRGRFPAATIRKDGKPLLSWRVALLPYVDEQALFARFHLDEPGDSPNNKPLLDQMPAIYAPAVRRNNESNTSTHFQIFTGSGALFGADEGPKREQITDGTNFTIMLVEAGKAVPWTKPEEVPFDPAKPTPELGGQCKHGFHVLCASGSVLFL